MSGKRLWLMGALVGLMGAAGCGPWCDRWCENHRPVPAVPVGYAAPQCCQPAPACCAPAPAPNWQRTMPNGCCP